MKKITLLLALLPFVAQAQNFPDPYCDIDGSGTTVEEITSVNFAGSSITNNDTSSILIDKTSTVVGVTSGETYTIVVEGNTMGEFDNNIVAFIDWNQNEVLDDTDEIYEIGTLYNSTGSDGISVSMDITVPSDAVVGTTRIRITKSYTDDVSIAEVDPCAIAMNIPGYGVFPGYGQALDFTLDVGALGAETFETNSLSIYPIPTQDVLNINYKSVLDAVKIYNLVGHEVYTQKTATSHVKLDLSMLAAGVYIVKLFTEEGQHNMRIIKK